ncbi:MAG: hypothetical protein JKY65_17965 [Planctomycetes bacterium]|nr:hypothetical protein [Planctomycetota bacterium]
MADLVPADALELLACPEDKSALSLAPTDQVEALNAAIAAGKIRNRAGEAVSEAVRGGLVRADEAYLYPIRDFPILLVDEGIELSQLG